MSLWPLRSSAVQVPDLLFEFVAVRGARLQSQSRDLSEHGVGRRASSADLVARFDPGAGVVGLGGGARHDGLRLAIGAVIARCRRDSSTWEIASATQDHQRRRARATAGGRYSNETEVEAQRDGADRIVSRRGSPGRRRSRQAQVIAGRRRTVEGGAVAWSAVVGGLTPAVGVPQVGEQHLAVVGEDLR